MSTSNIIDINNPPAAADLRPKTPSPRQIAANRANSQKSTGPRTDQGREQSRFNALKHGLTAQHVCLPGESRDDYDQRRRQYIQIFKPVNLLELELVDNLTAAIWASQRYVKMETLTLIDQVLRSRINLADNYFEVSPDGESALAFRVVADESNALKLLERYAARASRDVRNAMFLLQEAIRMRPSAPAPAPLELPNEANPEIEHSHVAPAAAPFVPCTAEPLSRAAGSPAPRPPQPVKASAASAPLW